MLDLNNIDQAYIKSLSKKELKELCSEIRTFLIENVSKTGGHLSSNLGVVELTVALYYVFDFDEDELIFDVGHQSYVHKILSGRAKDFSTLRKYNGLSGYISRSESKYDIWESGHSSTSISAATGLLIGDPSKREIVVIGDSSIMNGVAFEGLNFLGQLKNNNPIIILNDNKMGITKSVGALSKTFKKLIGTNFRRKCKAIITKVFPNIVPRIFHRLKRFVRRLFSNGNIFEDMGFDYYGPYNGNDLNTMIKLLKRVKMNKMPLILHINTIKGKGYAPSEGDQNGDYHGVPPFDIKTGKPLDPKANKISYSKLIANYLVNKRKDEDFIVITPAMKSGAKLEEFANKYPNDFYDVGIAEEHAAVMAAGVALHNKKVVLLMYSTFAQRAYDQILNDIARQNLKVIIGIDRAGIVGEDGVTHQGLYDVAMFMAMPNIVVTMPKDEHEAIGLFNYAFECNRPIVIRYPRAIEDISLDLDYNYKCDLRWTILNSGKKAIALGYGPDIERLSKLCNSNNLDVMVVNARSIKPIDEEILKQIFEMNAPIVVFEQVISSGCLYHRILEYKEKNSYMSKIYKHSFDSETLIPHGCLNDVYANFGLSDDDLVKAVKEVMND
ncbi:MAG: 1-deoxy-D-xylulose-5-phosphate synthase [Anaeroplasma sp.]